jgi:hypothetical protein
MDTMITLRRFKDTTKERLIGLVDDTEVISVERTVFEPSWKVTQQSDCLIISRWPKSTADALAISFLQPKSLDNFNASVKEYRFGGGKEVILCRGLKNKNLLIPEFYTKSHFFL